MTPSFNEPTKLACAEAIKVIRRLEEETDNAIVRNVLQDTITQLNRKIAYVALEEMK